MVGGGYIYIYVCVYVYVCVDVCVDGGECMRGGGNPYASVACIMMPFHNLSGAFSE